MSRRTPRSTSSTPRQPTRVRRGGGSTACVKQLQARLAEAEETLRAIQSGNVDAVVVSGPEGERVFTLRGAEYAYRALVEAMNEGAATISRDGILLYCNGKIAPLLQLPAGALIGRPVMSLIAECDQDAFAGLLVRSLAGDACKAEIRLQRADGSTVTAYVSLSPLPREEQGAVCMVVTDLREHKQRDELIAAGNLAQSILRHAAEAIAVCDHRGRIILANDALRALCGRNPQFEHFDAALPLRLVDHHSSVNDSATRFSISSVLTGETAMAREVLYRRSDGLSSLLLSAGRIDGNQAAGCVLTLVDISKRKAAEKALLRSEKLAATGRLAASIAHEINNPLTAIYNLLFLIEQQPDKARARKLAAEALHELSRVSHITKQTLAFYRESSQPNAVCLSEVLQEILSLFRKELQTRKLVVSTSFRVAGEVYGYPGEMRQIFSNLIRNAMEAAPEGGRIRLYLRPSHHDGNEGVGVFVFDNGPGIPQEIRNRIFEPFFTTKGQKGTGLGLWVAKDLIEKHGGAIGVSSRASAPRTCTCFYVFVPSGRQAGKESPPAVTAIA